MPCTVFYLIFLFLPGTFQPQTDLRMSHHCSIFHSLDQLFDLLQILLFHLLIHDLYTPFSSFPSLSICLLPFLSFLDCIVS